MRIYVARHGETRWNSERRMQGQTDIPLNEKGLAQAEALADALERENIAPDRIYASPLSRARQTAEAVAKRRNLPVITLEGVQEVGFGAWEGLVYNDEIQANDPELYAAWRADRLHVAPPGGESCQDVVKRLGPAMERVLNDGDGTVLIVMHGSALKTLLFAVNGMPFSEFSRVSVVGNGEYAELDPEAVRRFAREHTKF